MCRVIPMGKEEGGRSMISKLRLNICIYIFGMIVWGISVYFIDNMMLIILNGLGMIITLYGCINLVSMKWAEEREKKAVGA